jgi:hypothetical protein
VYVILDVDIRELNKCNEIAGRFIDLGILKQSSFEDCRHIANAIVSGCDAIVSWNFRHIVNVKTQRGDCFRGDEDDTL